jgi:hypothetical protein
MDTKHRIIEFSKIGSSVVGYISIIEQLENDKFNIQRVFWTYFTPEEVVRVGIHTMKLR